MGKFIAVNNLECKICVNTYKMFFVENTEDLFSRLHLDKGVHRNEFIDSSKERFRRWLDSQTAGFSQLDKALA